MGLREVVVARPKTEKAKGKDSAAAAAGVERRSAKVVYERAEGFREVFITGAVGGASPRGEIHLALYQERHPYPLASNIQLSSPPEETIIDWEPGDIVRVMEIGVTLELRAAKALARWLTSHVDSLERVRKEVEEDL